MDKFKDLFTEGMNQKKQIGMLSKENFDKALKSGKIFTTEVGKVVGIMGEIMLDGVRVRFTKAYQAYRKAFKNQTLQVQMVTESKLKLNIKKIVLDYFKKNNINKSARVEGDRGIYRITIPGQENLMILADRFGSESELISFLDDNL